jgi:uncharacterized protein YqeY
MTRKEIFNLQKEFMKEHNPLLSVLRLLLADIKNKEIDKHSELTDDEVTKVIQKAVKEKKDSVESFKVGGRDVTEMEIELSWLQSLLPEEMSEDEIKSILEAHKDEITALQKFPEKIQLAKKLFKDSTKIVNFGIVSKLLKGF